VQVKWKGYKIAVFRQISRFISKTTQDTAIVRLTTGDK